MNYESDQYQNKKTLYLKIFILSSLIKLRFIVNLSFFSTKLKLKLRLYHDTTCSKNFYIFYILLCALRALKLFIKNIEKRTRSNIIKSKLDKTLP